MRIRYEEPLFRPPSEANSLIFQITVGCSRNKCTFCGMYKGKPFRIRPVEEILDEIASVPERYRPAIRRVFLADGDALIYPMAGLVQIMEALSAAFPNLNRVGSYASPVSLDHKSPEELQQLKVLKLGVLYFGLETGDSETLAAIDKGYNPDEMAELALKARNAGIKLSVTAILGLAGKGRSLEHARATAQWVNRVNPEFFSLLTMFHRHNEDFLRRIELCSRRELLAEALEIVTNLHPQRTILRSNHVSNFLNLAGSYPKDRQRLIEDVQQAIARGERMAGFMEEVPGYTEEYY
ncbi:MAG TPA: radical SAM protein [Deltaproteobacteria bacterium]|nr:radical SAM protein [Deltaproteobacteria bacterium]HQB39076.1 radical SAM protein [Deltaproteobacteria bacterium]